MKALAIACVTAAAACGAPAHTATDPLVGVWRGSTALTVQTAGALTLRRHDDAWTATIGTITAPLVLDAGWLHADLGTGEVRFRPERHEAFWLQGPGMANPNAFAMPLVLTGDEDVVHADVVPLAERLRLIVYVTSPTTAFIREPEHNLGHRFGLLAITRTGRSLVFTAKSGDVVAHGTLRGATLHVQLDGIDIGLDLTRADAARDSRALGVPAAGDGWTPATLESVGMQRGPLQAWVTAIADTVPTSADAPAIQAQLIARHGKLVVEHYFDGYTADTPHDTRSSGKSWGTTLVGIHIDRHELALSTLVDPARPITLEHVVSMTTGLDCDDTTGDNPGNEDVMQSQTAERDWYRYALALKSVRPPGERGVYCTGAINLGGYLLGRATHEWLPALFAHDLGRPLGMAHYYLNLMPTTEGYLGGGLYLRPRDFAKLPQVFLDHGTWHGTPIVSAEWVEHATAAHTSIHHPDDYGYGWWRTTYRVDGHDYAAFYTSGNGGQLGIAIPELDVVVAIMAGNYQDFATWKRFVEEDVARYVITAIASR